MSTARLKTVVEYADRLLHTGEFKDWDGAMNGLQVENDGHITRLAVTVDASLATVRLAVAARADFLIVHHGLFWNPSYPWTGSRYRLMRLLLENNLAVYSSHLPLDAHPRLGNNAQLANSLGIKRTTPFFVTKGQLIGLRGALTIQRGDLASRLEQSTGRAPIILPGGPQLCRRIGIVTGGAGAELQQAAHEGVDTFITGEGPHWTYAKAEEAGINVLYGGHYATETFGVKALGGHLAKKFRLPWTFIDYPTGL